MANFKGFKQVTLAEYNLTSADEKKGYLWLVRELSGETVLSSAMYFGSRKYAELNNDDERAANLVVSLGSMVKSDGTWDGFLPIEEHEILGESTDTSDALLKLESAVLSLKSRMASAESAITELEASVATKASASAVTALENRMTSAETSIIELGEEIDTKARISDLNALESRVTSAETLIEQNERITSSALTNLDNRLVSLASEVDLKANISDVYTKQQVYTKEEVDGKVAGTFKFMGDALEISDDKKSIKIQSGETQIWIEANDSNRGHVYQIGEKEYASNGTYWVELGFNIDLSSYAKKSYVDEKFHVFPVNEYGFNTNLRENQTVSGSQLVDAVVECINAGESVAVKAGDFKFTVANVLNTSSTNPFKAFSCIGMMKGNEDTLNLDYEERCIFLVSGDSTYTYYSTDLDASILLNENLQNLAGVVSQLNSSLTEEIQARTLLAERVTVTEQNIVRLQEVATLSAQTFDDVVVSAMSQGQIVYVKTDEEIESGRTAGAYIKIGDSLKKLDVSSGQGDTPLSRIESLETKVGTTVIPGEQTITEALAGLITLTGNDVE